MKPWIVRGRNSGPRLGHMTTVRITHVGGCNGLCDGDNHVLLADGSGEALPAIQDYPGGALLTVLDTELAPQTDETPVSTDRSK